MDRRTQTIVAGIPRCGTTLLFRALAGLRPGATTPPDYEGPIVKTHSFRPDDFEGARRAFFLFGDPVAAVLSTRARRYDAAHFANCGAGGIDPERVDIFEQDHLNYERMFDAWTRRQSVDLLCLRYETLFDNLEAIESFWGAPLQFPPHRPRKTDPGTASPADAFRAAETYARLAAKVRAAPDVALFRAGGDGPPGVALLRLGERVRFTKTGNGAAYLGDGWHRQEREFTHAAGDESTLRWTWSRPDAQRVRAAGGLRLRLWLRPLLRRQGGDARHVEIELDSAPVFTGRLAEGQVIDLTVPAAPAGSVAHLLRIVHRDRVSPADARGSTDTRQLSVALSGLQVDAVSPGADGLAAPAR